MTFGKVSRQITRCSQTQSGRFHDHSQTCRPPAVPNQPPKACPPHNHEQVTYKVALIEQVPLPSPSDPQSKVENKCSLNGNSPSLRVCLVPFLLPEEWEEPTGRSFHSAPAVVILEETGWEDDSRVGGRGSCVLVDGMRVRAKERKMERNTRIDPYYLLQEGYVFAAVYLSACLFVC